MSEHTGEQVEKRGVVAWAVGVGAVGPGLLAVVSMALIAAWWNELPEVVPHHWNASGRPDEFGGRSSFIATVVVLSIALPGLMAAFTFPGLVRGARGFAYRLLPSVALAISSLGATLGAGYAWLHRGVPEGGPWPNTGWGSAIGFGVAVALGVSGYFAQPRQHAVRHTLPPRPALEVAPGERVTWIRTSTISRWLLGLLAILAVGMAAGGVALWASGQVGAGATLLGTGLFIGAAGASSTSFRVTVDRNGLRAVSAIGWPRFHVALDDVESVAVADVNGLAEFGGYGLRSAPGADGVVLRDGQAIEVTKRSGRRFVVTVDDAATGAALLATLAKAKGA